MDIIMTEPLIISEETRIDSANVDRVELSKNIVINARTRNFGKLYLLLVNIFGPDKTKKKVGKREGQEVEFYFKAYDQYITLTLSSIDLKMRDGPSENAVATLKFKMDAEDIIPIACKVIKMKPNIFSLAKVVFKYMLTNKLSFSGSIGATLRAALFFMVGNDPSYKKGKVEPLVLKPDHFKRKKNN
jgi:hypothetical protein